MKKGKQEEGCEMVVCREMESSSKKIEHKARFITTFLTKEKKKL